MNWEPMTEDANLIKCYHLLIRVERRKMWEYHACIYLNPSEQPEEFFVDVGVTFTRSDITHFCRITNPNKGVI